MFYKSEEEKNLEKLINEHIDFMRTGVAGTPEYTAQSEELERLFKAKSYISHRFFDPNTILTVGANLLGIIVIIYHERAHVITTKAFNWIRRV